MTAVRGEVLPAAPAPTEAAASAAFEAEQRIKLTLHTLRSSWIVLAEQLWHFLEQRQWRALGYERQEEWLASPDVELSARMVLHLRELWRELVVERGIDPRQLEGIGWSKARDVLPAVRRGFVDVEEALEDARALSRRDLREKYDELTIARLDRPGETGQEPPPPIDATREPVWCVCDRCGTEHRAR